MSHLSALSTLEPGLEDGRAGEQPDNAAALDRVAYELERTGWATALLDSEWTLTWVSSQLRLFMGGAEDAELGVGHHFCEALQTPAWRGSITTESRERWLADSARYVAIDTVGGVERMRELVAPEDRRLLNGLEPAVPPPLWGWTIQFLQDDLPAASARWLAIRHESDGASLEGLDRLSMRRLAAEVGISKSALYEHFTSKEELQLAVIGHGRDVFEAEVVGEHLDNADGGLGALLERWVAFFEDEVFPGGCFFITAAVDFASRPGRVRDALERGLDREVEVLEAAIAQAREAGEPRVETDAGQTAFELHAVLLHANALFQIKRDPAVLQRARAALRARV